MAWHGLSNTPGNRVLYQIDTNYHARKFFCSRQTNDLQMPSVGYWLLILADRVYRGLLRIFNDKAKLSSSK